MNDSLNSHWYFLGLVATKEITVLVPASPEKNEASSDVHSIKEDDLSAELADLEAIEMNLIDQISDVKSKVKKKRGGRK